MPSLLDRLFDDDPDRPQDPPGSEYALSEAARLGLRRDLEALLNTRRPFYPWVEGVADSVVGYGLSDITTEDFSSATTRGAIARTMAHCIQRFEPRLSKVEIDFDTSSPTAGGVRFKIRAELRDGDESGPVEFGARLRSADRNILIESSV